MTKIDAVLPRIYETQICADCGASLYAFRRDNEFVIACEQCEEEADVLTAAEYSDLEAAGECA